MVKVISLVSSLALTALLAYPLGRLYDFLFVVDRGFSSFIVPEGVANFVDGVPAAFFFSSFLLFSLLSGRHKYVWIFILVVPVVVFEVYNQIPHAYFPPAMGLVGWLLAQGILYVRGLVGRKTAA